MASTTNNIMKIVKRYLNQIRKSGIKIDAAYLYGSYAKGASKEYSDIDIAIISSDFSGNRINDWDIVMPLAWDIDVRIEPIPFTPEKFAQDWHPLVYEIKKTGIKIDV